MKGDFMKDYYFDIIEFFKGRLGFFIRLLASALPLVFISSNVIVWFVVFFILAFIPFVGDFVDILLWWVGLYFAITGTQVVLSYVFYVVFIIWFIFVFLPFMFTLLASLFQK